MLPMRQTALLLYFLFHKCPKPLAFWEAVLRLVLLSPCLAALLINPLFTADFGISAFQFAAWLDKLNLVR